MDPLPIGLSALHMDLLRGEVMHIEQERRIASVAEVGPHSVFFCEVRGIATAPQPEGLIYFNRLYHPIGASLKSIDEAYA